MRCVALVAPLLFAACAAEPDRPLCEPGRACATASVATCAHGPEATRHGRAGLVGGTCGPVSDATCRAATLTCALWGQCHAPPPGYPPPAGTCADADDRDFQASRRPECAVGTCVALADDCATAGVCALEGRCAAQSGVCVAADDAACAASERCATLGWCSRVGAVCRPASPADCERSALCGDLGSCAFSAGKCVPCQRSPDCRADGLCQRVGRACRATRAEHCRSAIACTRHGRCRPHQGTCVK